MGNIPLKIGEKGAECYLFCKFESGMLFSQLECNESSFPKRKAVSVIYPILYKGLLPQPKSQ